MKLFDGKRITVVGLGTHGGAVGNIRWLWEQGADLTVTDLKPAAELEESIQELQDLPDIQWVLGRHQKSDFTDTDMVVRNPAVPRRSPYLQAAREAHVPIEMDSSLFFKYSPTRNIIGVTGSKGKTTATLAIAHLLKLVFPRVALVGVETTSPLEALNYLTARDTAVFELSSWRIEALQEHHISPHTAVITSLYQDHLNTYDSFAEYITTKKALLSWQTPSDRVLLNYDDPLVRQWATGATGSVKWYTLASSIPGEGVYVSQHEITIRQGGSATSLFPIHQLPFQSDHQRRNLLPAIYLAFCNNVRIESIRQQLQHLEKPAHRLEFVTEIQGVQYINDSAATIPDATIAALDAFRDKHIVLIAGGSDKKLNFTPLARRLPDARMRAIVLLPGNATPHLLREIRGAYESLPPITETKSMTEAVRAAYEQARAGDIVLLSPGATSFGLFKHEFDRGAQFRAALESLY